MFRSKAPRTKTPTPDEREKIRTPEYQKDMLNSILSEPRPVLTKPLEEDEEPQRKTRFHLHNRGEPLPTDDPVLAAKARVREKVAAVLNEPWELMVDAFDSQGITIGVTAAFDEIQKRHESVKFRQICNSLLEIKKLIDASSTVTEFLEDIEDVREEITERTNQEVSKRLCNIIDRLQDGLTA
jgi:hypothetical protein